MRMYERSGIHVDQCTDCRGIFLDRGELEHLVSMEARWNAPAATPSAPPPPDPYAGQYSDKYSDKYSGGYGKPYKKKRSFLEELFD